MRQSPARGSDHKFRLLASAAFATLAFVSPAAAQTEAEDEIIVTAQKRSERLEDVPISIAAVSGEELDNLSLNDVMALPQSIPALRITRSGTFVQPTIRGIGSQVALPGLPQNITTYVDGYYVPDPATNNFEFIDLESVNVLKGPQGTLFGYNTTGGAIQITTLTPEHDPSAFARFGYGSNNHLSGAFYGTTGFSPTLAADLAIAYDHGDGYITNIISGDDRAGEFENYYIRSKILWEPSDGMRFTLGLAHSWEDDPATQNVFARNNVSIAVTNPPLPATITTNRGEVSFDQPGFSTFETSSITLTSEFDLGFANLTSYTGYRTDEVWQGLDYDASSAPINFSYWRVPDTTFTEEVDLASSGDGAFNWVVGGFFMHTEDEYDYNTNNTPIFTSNNTTESVAVFADGTYEVASNLFVTLGGRYTWDTPEVNSFLIPFSLTTDASADFSKFTGRAVVRYEMTPDSNIYASYTQGYKAGGLPASSFSPVPVEPETIDAYEVGYKLSDGAVRFSMAGYFYDYRDIQVTAYGAGGQSITSQADGESYGLDADLTWAVTPDFSMTVNAAWNQAEYTSFPAAARPIPPATPPASVTLIPIASFNATGRPIERTPDLSANFAIDYGFDLGGGRMSLNGNLFYTGDYSFDIAGDLPQDAYTLVNLRATWTDPSEKFDLSVFGTNVTDELYLTSNFTDPYASRATWGDPALWGASVTYHFR